MPLTFARLDMGALVLLTSDPAKLDKYARRLCFELGLLLGQTLYTQLCMEHMRVGDEIIHDIMPAGVSARQERRAGRVTAMHGGWVPECLGSSACMPVANGAGVLPSCLSSPCQLNHALHTYIWGGIPSD